MIGNNDSDEVRKLKRYREPYRYKGNWVQVVVYRSEKTGDLIGEVWDNEMQHRIGEIAENDVLEFKKTTGEDAVSLVKEVIKRQLDSDIVPLDP